MGRGVTEGQGRSRRDTVGHERHGTRSGRAVAQVDEAVDPADAGGTADDRAARQGADPYLSAPQRGSVGRADAQTDLADTTHGRRGAEGHPGRVGAREEVGTQEK